MNPCFGCFDYQPWAAGFYSRPCTRPSLVPASCFHWALQKASDNVLPAGDIVARQTAVNSLQDFFKKILSSANRSQRYVKFSRKAKGTHKHNKGPYALGTGDHKFRADVSSRAAGCTSSASVILEMCSSCFSGALHTSTFPLLSAVAVWP